MGIITLVLGKCNTNCYIVYSEKTKECIIIDAADQADAFINVIEEYELIPKMIVITHGHTDHVLALHELAERYLVPVVISQEDSWRLLDEELINERPYVTKPYQKHSADLTVKEGDIITVADISLRVFMMPGHTPGSIALIGNNCIFTGDTLLRGGHGKTTLPGGDEQELIKSINRLAKLPEDYTIYPGHRALTTLEEERKNNKFIQKMETKKLEQEGIKKRKYRFVIVGSGWRSMYYVRVAKALPDVFELSAMLCRTIEKADKMAEEYNIHTTLSKEECEEYKPDFVVVAVNKSSIGTVSKEWMSKGFTVLCETPPTQDVKELCEFWRLHENGYKLCVSEQYFRYPTYQAMLNVLNSGIIGEPYNVNISLAHEYHGASLIKKILHTENETFTITGKRYSFPVKETANRYEQFTDGRVAEKTRDCFTIEFESGKVAFYDFSSEQYRSGIRSNYVKVQGVNGELQGVSGSYGSLCKIAEGISQEQGSLQEYDGGLFAEIHYMDENNHPRKQYLTLKNRQIITGNENPNLNEITEVMGAKLGGYQYNAEGGKTVYEPQKEFGLCGLAEDETAIASMMLGAAEYHNGGDEIYSLKDALTDAYIAGLMQKALENPGTVIQSERQPWQRIE